MINTINNRFLEISASSFAAELVSFKALSEKQLLWQGDQQYWMRQAPILFPIVGSLPDNKYILDDKLYELGTHGFAASSEFELMSDGKEELSYRLVDNTDTLSCYPFHFELVITYKLIDNTLQQVFSVRNTDSQILPFSLGTHPGFNCPLFEDETLEDYCLSFEKKENVKRRLLKGKLPGDEMVEFLDNEQEKILSYEMFDQGAVILSGLESNWVELKSIKSGTSLKIDFTGFPYLFIWSPPLKKAPFVCIEPCNGIGSRAGSGYGFMEKEGLIFLEPGKTFERTINFTYNEALRWAPAPLQQVAGTD